MGYKTLTIIQMIFIILVGFSLVDLGVANGQEVENPLDPDNKGLFLNDQLFSTDGIIGGILEDLDQFWNIYAYWSYCLLAVAILQILKATSVDA